MKVNFIKKNALGKILGKNAEFRPHQIHPQFLFTSSMILHSETVMLMKTSEETEVALDILDSVDEDEENSEVKEVS